MYMCSMITIITKLNLISSFYLDAIYTAKLVIDSAVGNELILKMFSVVVNTLRTVISTFLLPSKAFALQVFTDVNTIRTNHQHMWLVLLLKKI